MKIFFSITGFLFLVCVFSVVKISAQETTRPQNGQNSEQVLKEILAELKQMRSTLAKTSVNQMRFQIVFDQYKAQQSRVDSLGREMESIKTQLTTNPYRGNTEDLVKQTEERLTQTTDPRQRQNLERQLESIKRGIEMQNQREKRLKERQTALEFQVPNEQAKLDQLNSELERIKLDINQLLSQ